MSARPGSLALALESSARTPSVALIAHGVLFEQPAAADAAHASDLLPTLRDLLQRAGSAPGDIDSVIVGLGPGSYTGLRVGVATALGLARGANAQLRGVSSTEALAYGALAPGEQGWVVLDARSGELYCAHYQRTLEDIESLRAPCVTTRDELHGWLQPGLRVFADEAAVRAADLDRRDDLRLTRDQRPLARHVLELGLKRLERLGPQSPEQVEPLYLRAFAAKSPRR